MKKLISIIVPVYNTEKYLDECLNSLLWQSLQEIEVICINDASSDNSLKKLNEYAAKDNRVSVIDCKKNMGQANARNIGLKKARGEYVFFVDSDDKVKEGALEYLYKISSNECLDLLTFDADVVYETLDLMEKYITKKKRKFPSSDIINGQDFLKKLLNDDDGSRAVWREFWRTDFLKNNHLYFYPESSPHEDRLFTFVSILSVNRMRYISESFYIYRCRPKSVMTGGITEKRFKSMCVICTELMKYIMLKYSSMSSDMVDLIKLCIYKEIEATQLYWKELLKQGHNPCYMNISSPIIELFCHVAFTGKYHLINRSFPVDIGDRLSKKSIIIYGAGGVCLETMQWLMDMDLMWTCIAVSNKNEISKGKVKNVSLLSELVSIKEKCIVLIAANHPYNNIMRATAESLGFNDFISMV